MSVRKTSNKHLFWKRSLLLLATFSKVSALLESCKFLLLKAHWFLSDYCNPCQYSSTVETDTVMNIRYAAAAVKSCSYFREGAGNRVNSRCLISNPFQFTPSKPWSRCSSTIVLSPGTEYSTLIASLSSINVSCSCVQVSNYWWWLNTGGFLYTHVNILNSRNMFRISPHVFCPVTIGYLQLVRTMAWWLTCIWDHLGTVIAINALQWTY